MQPSRGEVIQVRGAWITYAGQRRESNSTECAHTAVHQFIVPLYTCNVDSVFHPPACAPRTPAAALRARSTIRPESPPPLVTGRVFAAHFLHLFDDAVLVLILERLLHDAQHLDLSRSVHWVYYLRPEIAEGFWDGSIVSSFFLHFGF